MVLAAHLRHTFFSNANEIVAKRAGRTAATFIAAIDGNFAVWLFWVMSAFVLSLRFHRCTEDTVRYSLLTDATLRRYPRLVLPVLASVLFAWILHHFGLMSNLKLAHLLGLEYDSWLAKFYLFEPNVIQALNSGLWQSFFDFSRSESYNRVLWTMEIELYGSFFLFAFLALFGKHPSRVLIYIVTLLIVFRLSLYWINAFVFGTMICDMFVNHRAIYQALPDAFERQFNRLIQNTWTSVVLLLPFIFLVGLPNAFGVFHLFLATILTAYVVVSPLAEKLLSSKIPVFLGKISFGLYLAHLPVICAAAYPIYTALLLILTPLNASVVASLMLIVLSVFAGWVLWFIADRPAIAFSRQVASVLQKGIANL